MRIVATVKELDALTRQFRAQGRSIGLVPTMGALHAGHLSLVEHARSDNDVVVVTVFVNPVQFNNAADLEHYPRTFDADRAMLESAGVDVMFHPPVHEVYPSPERKTYDLDGLDAHMEGPNRPGHFDGVVQVVTRFFDIVGPDAAYFGEKDFQQLSIIRHMATKLGYALQVIGCATVREADGVAMSSRNTLLTAECRIRAAAIYRAMCHIRDGFSSSELTSLIAEATLMLEAAGLRPEYVEVVDEQILSPVVGWTEGGVRVCVAAWAGEVRLIDNLKVK
jgi:pantoate--beta-alanine ligase